MIQEALLQSFLSSHQLEAAILSYNSKYTGRWDFAGLHYFFNEVKPTFVHTFFIDNAFRITSTLSIVHRRRGIVDVFLDTNTKDGSSRAATSAVDHRCSSSFAASHQRLAQSESAAGCLVTGERLLLYISTTELNEFAIRILVLSSHQLQQVDKDKHRRNLPYNK